ncbi:MAG: MotA/TolQ/ExbB proton channel family protein [Planctomycetes bacterium]|nr:MotA/TolQ/ExbB proton channel family protein [Planctomycetota bacterium]
MLGFATAAVLDTAPAQTFWEFLRAGGPVMVPIGLCSVIVLGLTLERLLRLRHTLILPAEMDGAVRLIEAGRFADAERAAAAIDAPAGRVLLAGLRRQGHSIPDVERAMEQQGAKEADRLRGPIRPIGLMGNVAPLLGLFGTVVGILQAFQQVVRVGMGRPEALAAGIEVALITTVAGLAVAIPAVVIAAWLQGRVRTLVRLMDERLAPLVERIAARPESSHAA